MKVKLRVELANNPPMVIEVEGNPTECATFLKLWMGGMAETSKFPEGPRKS